MKRTLITAILGAAIALVFGCEDAEYQEIEVVQLTTPPRPASITTEGPNTIAAGVTVAISIKPSSSSGQPYTINDKTALTSQDETILIAKQSSMRSVFILAAVQPGQTTLDFSINEQIKETIEIQVTNETESSGL